jgi:2-hydroxy-3-keto-5-methylthiopentenyl-1-phosphate phosphatase
MNLSNNSFKIFCDFDGTISQKDVGEEMFVRFGSDKNKIYEIAAKWMNFDINPIEAWTQTCNTVKEFKHEDFDSFLSEIQIDVGFKSFVEWCNSNGYELRVLSDGFDYYIKKLLKREGLNNITTHTNLLNFGVNNELKPAFPYTDEECKKCANCKRNHILNNSCDEEFTVYVGDGFTDYCPAQFCDFIFAKGALLKYCEMNRITYFPYNTFNDVLNKLSELKEKKRLKKRHQAELKRREVFIQG